jgi:large subunit ribosomal protein L32
MPVPKKRHSNTRTRTRRANWKLSPLNLGLCPQCKSPVLPHHACPVCGTYQGRAIIKIESKEAKGKEKSKS